MHMARYFCAYTALQRTLRAVVAMRFCRRYTPCTPLQHRYCLPLYATPRLLSCHYLALLCHHPPGDGDGDRRDEMA
jgi:hypothetical protein